MTTISSHHGTAHYGQTSKSTRTFVKPILKKLAQSPKSSLDLDRPTEAQDGLGIYGYGYGYGNGNRSLHDVDFGQSGRRGHHNRTISNGSQFSTTTSGSGVRVAFIHPCQQTPNPPLTLFHEASLREGEQNGITLTPEEDENQNQLPHNNSNLSLRSQTITGITSPVPGVPLRIQTTRQPSASRLALATSYPSNTSLANSLALSPEISSPIDTMSPASAIRTSIDRNFRVRSRSEVDTRSRSESIHEARRKFAEREQAKDEKAAQEEIRAREKRNQKEARQTERGHRRSSASNRTRTMRSRSDLTMLEKDGVVGQGYDNAGHIASEQESQQPRRSQTGYTSTKQKTHGKWTSFLIWFRMRLLNMSGKKDTTKHRRT